jgi:virginiamycin A acetyltransferase
MLVAGYGAVRSELVRVRMRHWITRLEGGPAFSLTIREILRRYYRVEVGLYSAGPCRMKPGVLHPGTSIGRYTFIAGSVRTFTRNHPMNIKSTHGFFYNAELGKVKTGPIRFNELRIGHGVSIGHNVVILFPTARVGDGAIIAPGSVVCADVPPYAVLSGFPARVQGYRFPKERIAELIASRWFEKPYEDVNPQCAGGILDTVQRS